jgi:hypothetical protein
MDGPGIMKHARQIKPDDSADAKPLNAALDVIEHLLAQLGPEADADDAALALWEPAKALGEAANKA